MPFQARKLFVVSKTYRAVNYRENLWRAKSQVRVKSVGSSAPFSVLTDILIWIVWPSHRKIE